MHLIEGDLAAFSQLVALKHCVLDKVHGVCGSISAFEKCVGLQVLSLSSCFSVDGDIESLGSCEQLATLSLENTKVTGAMDVFRKLPKLQYLNLRGTKIKGNIANLSECLELQTAILEARDSALVGNVLDAFKHHKKLREVNLKQCFRLEATMADLNEHMRNLDPDDQGNRRKWKALLDSNLPHLKEVRPG